MVHELEPFDLKFCSSETVSRLGHARELQYPDLQILEEFVLVHHVRPFRLVMGCTYLLTNIHARMVIS